WASYTVAIAPLMRRYSPYRISAVVLAIGWLPLALVSIPQINRQDFSSFSGTVWLCFAYAVIGPLFLTNILWFTAVDRVGAPREEPAGMVGASERARAEARAPLLARMDADAVALPERLEIQVAAIEEEGLAVVGGRVEYFPDPTDGMRAYADWLNSLVTVEA